MATEITKPHEKALMLLFAELESTAAEQRHAFLGTPGAITERTNENGTRFWVHRYSDGVGRRHEDYLGTADDEAVIARIRDLRVRIEAANAALGRNRIFAAAGFSTPCRQT